MHADALQRSSKVLGLTLMIVCMTVSSSCGRAQPETAEIVLVAGQSNALGFGLNRESVPAALRRGDPRTLIWTGTTFEPMEPGVNTGTPTHRECWGPEAEFARRWREANPRGRLYIVKSAKGSTPLAAGPGLDWSPESHELFSATTDRLEKAKAVLRAGGQIPRIHAILWMQGESDAEADTRAAAYPANLPRLISRMRKDWGDQGSRIVVGRIAPGLPFAALVRAAQADAAAAGTGVRMVDTDSYPRSDGLHYAAAGQVRLGADMYAAIAERSERSER